MMINLPYDSLGFLLHDTARHLKRRFDQKVRPLGLTRAQWQFLALLSRNEGSNQASLAEVLEVEPITVSRLIDRMEENGWVERRPHPTDRRARVLFTTDKSRAIVAEMRALAEGIYAEALAGVSPEARVQLMGTLRQIHSNLSERSADMTSAAS